MKKKNEPPGAESMRKMARIIDEILNGKGPSDYGFALFIFKTNDPGMANYIGNCQRADMLKALKETVARWEAGQDFPTPEEN